MSWKSESPAAISRSFSSLFCGHKPHCQNSVPATHTEGMSKGDITNLKWDIISTCKFAAGDTI